MRSIRSFLCVCVVALLVFCCDLSAQTMAKPAVVIQTGSMVAFDYTLTDESGTVIDSSKGKEPMHYVHGKGQIIPGLEKELAGMPVGGEKKVTVEWLEHESTLRCFCALAKHSFEGDKLGVLLIRT